MSKRSNKRLPTIPNANVGKICEIQMENFLTYKKFKFHAEPYLNLIIGPNGTGKSSIVSAIVIVFGGEPKLLGRNNDLSTYVRSGSSSAYVCAKIYSKKNDEYVKFQRNFNVECVSEYRINGSVVTKTMYLKEVNSFNIQISNLCQFLPQDRVQEFARMSSHDMLLNTLKSVCSEQVSLDLNTLITLRKQQVNGVNEVTTWKKKLLESEKRLNDLKEILSSYKLRNNISDRIGLCNLKIVNLEKSLKETEIKSFKKDLNEATKVLKKYTKLVESMIWKKNQIKNQTEQLAGELQKAKLKQEKLEDEMKTCFQQIEEANNNISRAKLDYKQKVEGVKAKQKQLQHAKSIHLINCSDYEKMQAEIETLDGSMAGICSEKEKLESELKCLVQKRSDISKEIEDDLIPMKQQIQNTINNYKDKIKKYEEFFRSKFPDVLKANEWIKQHRSSFKANVYSPILMEINVLDPNNVKYFESIIPIRDLCAFTVEDTDDFSFLVNELNTKLNLKINLCFSEPATKCRYSPNVPILKLKPHGFHSYMVDLLKGPPSIINHLCSLFNIHNIPVGNADVHKHTANIPANIHTFFGGNSRYSVTISKYSKLPSTVKTTISGKNIISSQNTKEINDMNQKLVNIMKELDSKRNQKTLIEAEISTIKEERTQLKSKCEHLQTQKSKLRRAEKEIEESKEKIRKITAYLESVPQLEKSHESTVHGFIEEIQHVLRLKIVNSRNLTNVISQKKQAMDRVRIYNSEKENIDTEIHDAEIKQQDSRTLVDKITAQVGKVKNTLDDIEMRIRNLQKKYDANSKYFKELPTTMDEMIEVKNELIARLECMATIDPEVIKEHESKDLEVKELTEKINTLGYSIENGETEMKELYVKWFPIVNNVIEAINKSFSEFMTEMQYVGEVMLSKVDDYDFERYGIQINVQFRKNVPLQALDKYVQSGGERAVATATYTLALQQLTHVPFRCVDEINQGMDATNERKIFNMIVNETTAPNKPQFFFVTPKLLPNLPCNDRMAIHVIFNGSIYADGFS